MLRVLVVEDNPLNMKLAVLVLRDAGHEVLCAGDAEAGLALAVGARPDLVLMDFQLPGMSGPEAAAWLKREPATAAIPVFALSADRDTPLSADFAGRLDKPLRRGDVAAVLDALHAGKEAWAGTGAGPPSANAGAVDIGVLAALIGDEPALLREFLRLFQASAAAIAPELMAACARRDTSRAGRLAHKLKSSARTAGALALAEHCAALETAGRADDLAALTALLPGFERALAAVDAFLEARWGG